MAYSFSGYGYSGNYYITTGFSSIAGQKKNYLEYTVTFTDERLPTMLLTFVIEDQLWDHSEFSGPELQRALDVSAAIQDSKGFSNGKKLN